MPTKRKPAAPRRARVAKVKAKRADKRPPLRAGWRFGATGKMARNYDVSTDERYEIVGPWKNDEYSVKYYNWRNGPGNRVNNLGRVVGIDSAYAVVDAHKR